MLRSFGPQNLHNASTFPFDFDDVEPLLARTIERHRLTVLQLGSSLCANPRLFLDLVDLPNYGVF